MLLLCALAGCLIKFGVFEGSLRLYQLRYFTNLSNILGGVYAGFALFAPKRNHAVLRGMAVLALAVTAVVYHTLLAAVFGSYVPFTLGWWGNLLVHTVTPVLMAGEWLTVRDEKPLRLYHPLIWVCFPLGYFAATVAIAKLGILMPNSATPYPYPFLDVWKLGWAVVLRNTAALAVGFLSLGYLLVGLDRLLCKKKLW